MVPLQYRDAQRADLPAIVAIYNSTIASRRVTADTEPVTVDSRKKWFDEHQPGKRPLWVVTDVSGETIGWVSFQSFYGRPAYDATVEISIYLREDQRGKGIGKEILQYALEKAPAFGAKTLLGFIFSHNEPSLRLFRSFGFESWALLPAIATMDDKEYGLCIVGKRIG